MMNNKIVWFGLLCTIMQLAYSSHIQRIPRNDKTASDYSDNALPTAVETTSVSSDDAFEITLDELKRNLTTGLPPDAAAIVEGILDNLKNTSSDSMKTVAGKILQLLFIPTVIELADNETVINSLTTAFNISDADNNSSTAFNTEKTDNVI